MTGHNSLESINTGIYEESAAYISARLPDHLKPPKLKVGIICGSGLGGLVDTLDKETKVEFAYSEIPGFVVSTVAGHAGKLVFGLIGEEKTPAIFMVGRFHYYEGHSLLQVTLPVRVMALLGIKTLIVTNAAGSLNPDFGVGNVAVLTDHINLGGLAGNNPLRGPNLEQFGTRFPAVSDAYTFALRRLAFRAAKQLSFQPKVLKEGVYCYVGGPSYETPAEARFLRSLGGDVVGMSTVPEIIVAKHCGLQILGLSLVTNQVVARPSLSAEEAEERGDSLADGPEYTATHEEVLAMSAKRALEMQSLVSRIIDLISRENL
ncbi:uncharacterized protein VTP21DRAFT_4704 [Calcarisporiella thermophila]|uniref:uncharacterized protein n=1 Tax=Calcarisporiella thermophila TaxID=911321 RepID=UPI003742EE48